MPERAIIIDSGPLVALMTHTDLHHEWAVRQVGTLPAPLLTCEPVITESFHLLRDTRAIDEFLAFLGRGTIQIQFSLMPDLATLAQLIHRYRQVPMSLADACLVRMSEVIPNSVIFTTESDFHIYRKHRRQSIPLIFPGHK